MKLILKYLKNYKLFIILNVILVLGFVLVEFGILIIMGKVIDNGIVYNDILYIRKMGFIMIVILIIGVMGIILLGYCLVKIFISMIRDIRNDIFIKI